MNTFILLCATLLAANDTAQVQAKVLYGTADETQNRADIELWISEAVAKLGSPLAQPYTNWIALSGEQQELYASMQGGRVVKARAVEQDGTYTVEISGFAIKPLQRKIALKPGERNVVKLTDYQPPNNIFIALTAPSSEQKKNRAEINVQRIDLKEMAIPFDGHIKGKLMVEIATPEKLAIEFPKEEWQVQIKKQVDFSKQRLVYSAWSYSEDDQLTYKVERDEMGLFVKFHLLYSPRRGELSDNRYLFAVPLDARCEMIVSKP